jgi:hypothetical protein
MRYLWQPSIEILEIFFKACLEISKELNRELTPEERETIFLYLMEKEGIKPLTATELTNEELWGQLVKDGKTILNVDKDGYKIIKKKEEEL